MSNIGITLLSVIPFIFLNVLECIIHQATIAAIVAIATRAVHQLLFTRSGEREGLVLVPTHVQTQHKTEHTRRWWSIPERDKLARLQSVLSLQRPSGAEGPAGAALALVLDRSDSSFCPPVH